MLIQTHTHTGVNSTHLGANQHHRLDRGLAHGRRRIHKPRALSASPRNELCTLFLYIASFALYGIGPLQAPGARRRHGRGLAPRTTGGKTLVVMSLGGMCSIKLPRFSNRLSRMARSVCANNLTTVPTTCASRPPHGHSQWPPDAHRRNQGPTRLDTQTYTHIYIRIYRCHRHAMSTHGAAAHLGLVLLGRELGPDLDQGCQRFGSRCSTQRGVSLHFSLASARCQGAAPHRCQTRAPAGARAACDS
jgi:hypothetical protein